MRFLRDPEYLPNWHSYDSYHSVQYRQGSRCHRNVCRMVLHYPRDIYSRLVHFQRNLFLLRLAVERQLNLPHVRTSSPELPDDFRTRSQFDICLQAALF